MWETSTIRKALDSFITNEPFPETAYTFVPLIIEETPAHRGHFDFADSDTGRAVSRVFRELAQLYRESDIEAAMRDRLVPSRSKGKALLAESIEAVDRHLRLFDDSRARRELFVQSLLSVLFTRGIVSYLSGVLLLGGSDEIQDPNLRREAVLGASRFCEDGRLAFDGVLQQLVEIERSASAASGAHTLSFAVHALLGFAPEKFGRIVMDLAKGESPYLHATRLRPSIETLRSAEDKARYGRDHIQKLSEAL